MKLIEMVKDIQKELLNEVKDEYIIEYLGSYGVLTKIKNIGRDLFNRELSKRECRIIRSHIKYDLNI